MLNKEWIQDIIDSADNLHKKNKREPLYVIILLLGDIALSLKNKEITNSN